MKFILLGHDPLLQHCAKGFKYFCHMSNRENPSQIAGVVLRVAGVLDHVRVHDLGGGGACL